MTIKQLKDSLIMRKLQPELKALQDKYKNEPMVLAQKQKEVYTREGYNPLGCLTNLLIQIPVAIALYQTVLAFSKSTPQALQGLYVFISNWIDSRGLTSFNTSFFGIQLMDSASKHISDGMAKFIPYGVLLFLLWGSNSLYAYVNSKIFRIESNEPQNPMPKDKEDLDIASMMTQSMNTSSILFMPIMLTITMYPIATIISLYLVTQNLLSILQILVINKFFINASPELESSKITNQNSEIMQPTEIITTSVEEKQRQTAQKNRHVKANQSKHKKVKKR